MKNIVCPALGIHMVPINEPQWKKEIRKVTPCPQRQDSVNAQLRDLIVIANKFGFYDASDYLEMILDKKSDPKPKQKRDLMINYKGYIIAESNESGGKAGRGQNKTKTLQVRLELGNGYLIKKQVTFTVGDPQSYNRAEDKCRKFVDDNPL